MRVARSLDGAGGAPTESFIGSTIGQHSLVETHVRLLRIRLTMVSPAQRSSWADQLTCQDPQLWQARRVRR